MTAALFLNIRGAEVSSLCTHFQAHEGRSNCLAKIHNYPPVISVESAHNCDGHCHVSSGNCKKIFTETSYVRTIYGYMCIRAYAYIGTYMATCSDDGTLEPTEGLMPILFR